MHYTIRVVPEHIMKLIDWGVLYIYMGNEDEVFHWKKVPNCDMVQT